MRPDVAFSTSFAAQFDRHDRRMLRQRRGERRRAGGKTRANHGILRRTASGVTGRRRRRWRAASPTFCVGSETPATFGAQTVLPAIDSPLRRTPPPSGATIGDMQPATESAAARSDGVIRSSEAQARRSAASRSTRRSTPSPWRCWCRWRRTASESKEPWRRRSAASGSTRDRRRRARDRRNRPSPVATAHRTRRCQACRMVRSPTKVGGDSAPQDEGRGAMESQRTYEDPERALYTSGDVALCDAYLDGHPEEQSDEGSAVGELQIPRCARDDFLPRSAAAPRARRTTDVRGGFVRRLVDHVDDPRLEPRVLAAHHLLRDAVHLAVVSPVEVREELLDAHARRAAEQIGQRRRLGVALPWRASARARTPPSSRTARRRCRRRGRAPSAGARASAQAHHRVEDRAAELARVTLGVAHVVRRALPNSPNAPGTWPSPNQRAGYHAG